MAFDAGTETINIQELMRTLEDVGPRLKGRAEDVSFVKRVVASSEFETLLKLHHEVTTGPTKSTRPTTMNSLELAQEISHELRSASSSVVQELIGLLRKPHIYNLISTHDKVANKEFPQEFLSHTKPNVETVHLTKDAQALGATIKSVDEEIVIARVLHGSLAHKSGQLSPGDVLISINGHPVAKRSLDDVADEMQLLKGMITLQVIRKSPSSIRTLEQNKFTVRMRPRFSYDPRMDPSLPCPEAGLGFCKGDILHVLDRDDPEWWQAAKEGNSLKTGLIPSLLRQLRNEHTQCSKSRSSKRVGTLTNFRRKIKSQKTLYDAYRVHDYGTEDVHPYEEVVKIAPQNNRPRPLILVATHPIVQLQAIMDQLMATDSNHFSLPRRQPHSLSRNEVVNIDDVLTVIASGKTCLFSIPPQAIRLYRTAEIRPFVAFFNPVFTENSLLYTGNEGKRLSKESALVKEKYNHLFDQILNYSDVQTGIRDISKIARRLRRDFQWVPANWVHTPFP